MLLLFFTGLCCFAAGIWLSQHIHNKRWLKIIEYCEHRRYKYYQDIFQSIDPRWQLKPKLSTDEEIDKDLRHWSPIPESSDKELRLSRIHEAGHALMALAVDQSLIIHLIGSPHSRLGRVVAGTLTLRTLETELTPKILLDRIVIAYGGYVAEQLFRVSTEDTTYYTDINIAVSNAHIYLSAFGGRPFYGYNYWHEFGFLEPENANQQWIDEIRELCQQARAEAERILTQERPTLEAIIKRIEHQPLLSRRDLQEIWRQHHPSP